MVNSVNIAHSSVYWKRLTQRDAIPGWLLVFWKLMGELSTMSFLRGTLKPIWNFLTSPTGNLVVIVAGFAWLASVAFWPRKAAVSPAPVEPDEYDYPVPVPSGPEITWGDKLEADDAQHTNERVIVVSCEPELHLLAPTDPYIDFKFTFVNATIFHLMSQNIDGPAYFGRDPIPQQPTLIDPPLSLRHGSKQWIKIRQFVSRELANTLQTSRGHVKLDFSRVFIKFSVVSPGNASPSIFLWFGSDDVTVANRD